MLQQTMLHAEHQALGATLVDFGGWDMPLWYATGAVKEHLAVIKGAGLFDIGHMAGIMVCGPDAQKALQWAFTKDLALSGPRAAYGAFLDDNGGVIDDAIIYPLPENRFLVILNVGKGARITDQLRADIAAKSLNAEVRDLAGTYSKMDLQGPATVRILETLVADAGAVFEKFPYFTFKGDIELNRSTVHLTDGTPVFLSRTGYTGEQGFEIFVPQDKAVAVWRAIVKAGEPYGVLPCGLAARDSLRAGAVLPLSQQDIGPWPFINHPWPFALPRDAEGAWTKDFVGRAALEKATQPYTVAFCGFDPRKVTCAEDHTHPSVLLGDETIGDVLTCVADVSIGRVQDAIVSLASPNAPEGFNPKGLICGFLRVDRPLQPGTRVTLADARRKVDVEIVNDIRPDRTARKALIRA